MRDVVWTLIIIWLIYRLVDIFKKKTVSSQNSTQSTPFNSTSNSSEEKIKNAVHKQADSEGEYVDFEEIK